MNLIVGCLQVKVRVAKRTFGRQEFGHRVGITSQGDRRFCFARYRQRLVALHVARAEFRPAILRQLPCLHVERIVHRGCSNARSSLKNASGHGGRASTLRHIELIAGGAIPFVGHLRHGSTARARTCKPAKKKVKSEKKSEKKSAPRKKKGRAPFPGDREALCAREHMETPDDTSADALAFDDWAALWEQTNPYEHPIIPPSWDPLQTWGDNVAESMSGPFWTVTTPIGGTGCAFPSTASDGINNTAAPTTIFHEPNQLPEPKLLSELPLPPPPAAHRIVDAAKQSIGLARESLATVQAQAPGCLKRRRDHVSVPKAGVEPDSQADVCPPLGATVVGSTPQALDDPLDYATDEQILEAAAVDGPMAHEEDERESRAAEAAVVEDREQKVTLWCPSCHAHGKSTIKCLGGNGAKEKKRYRYRCQTCDYLWSQISPKFLIHGQDPDVQISSHRKMRDKPVSRAAKAPITLGGVAGDGRRQVQGFWYMREESAPSTHNVVVMATPVHGALMRGGCEKRLANLG